MDSLEKKISKIIDNYNKVASYTTDFSHPSLNDLLQLMLYFYDDVKKYKPNQLMGGLFMLLCEIHHVNDNLYIENGLRLLRTISKYSDCIDIARHLNKLLNQEHLDEIDKEALKQEALEYLNQKGIFRLLPLPKKGIFTDFIERQNHCEINKEQVEYIEDIIWEMFHHKVHNYLEIAYKLLTICPLAHSSLTIFINVPFIKDKKPLLKAIINAFEILHKDEMSQIDSNFYEYKNFRDYILSLDSLGFIYKRHGEYDMAVHYYDIALKYDDKDVLHIKEAILFPLLATGKFDRYLTTLSTLSEFSIYKTYLNLFNAISTLDLPLDYILYEHAYESSPLLMKMICEKKDLYNEASNKEKRFIEDFYDIWMTQEGYIEILQNYYYKRDIC